MHRRRVAPLYRFVYRIFFVLLDIDRVSEVARRVGVFSHNRFNLLSFFDKDHGGPSPGGLRAWVEGVLAQGGVTLQGGRIRLLTQPRMLGIAFNPVSFFYCEHANGELRAIIAEVRNTFGERHSYLLTPPCLNPPASAGALLPYDRVLVKDKCFHVSPLFDLQGTYHFQFGPPAERIRVVLKETRLGAPLIDTTVAGQALPFTSRTLLAQFLRMPVQAAQVMAGIHWQALKIWLRGAKFHSKPPPPQHDVT